MKNLLAEPFYAIWKNRSILLKLTRQKIQSRHKSSLLGSLWIVLDPLLMLGVYLFVFGYVFGGSFTDNPDETKIDYALTVFLGLSIFRLFSEILSIASMSIVSNVNYVKKIVFPLELLPVIDVLKAMHSFIFSLILILIGNVILGNPVGIGLLWWIVFIPVFLIFLVGVAWILSAFTVYFRDINNTVQLVSMSFMFGSAIFYPISKIPEEAWIILKYNPILQFVEFSRRITIWNISPDPQAIVFLLFISFSVFYMGFLIFKRLRAGFADVL